MRLRLWKSLMLLALLFTAHPAYGQGGDPELEALKARLDALERQNEELRKAVTQRLPQVEGENSLGATDFTGLNFEAPAGAAAAAAAAGHEVGSDLSMTGSWNNGLEFATKNKDFRIHIGGRTQLDTGWYSVDRNIYTPTGGPTTGLSRVYGDGADFRRARLRIDGTMYELIDFAAEYDFVNSARVGGQTVGAGTPAGFFDEALTAPTDLWWQFREVPVLGTLKIGNQKEQIGFEHIVSSRFLPFMERSYNQDTFYGGGFNGFTPGITALNTYGDDDVGVWALGVYKPSSSVFAFNTGDGDYSVTGRVTRLLWYADEGDSLVHVGVSGRQASAISQAGVPGRIAVFRTRDAVRTGLSTDWPTPANIALYGDDMQWLNSELVAVYGPWTFQSEYLVSGLQDAQAFVGGGPTPTDVGTVTYHGGYVQVLRYLTGEHDHYSKKTGAFERVKPNENFFFVRDSNGNICRGRGAWQIGARYNYLDLNDKGLNGGIVHNMTYGLNWFLNPNMKMQFNYIATYRDAPLAGTTGDGWIHGFGIRLAHDF